jgi:hypothetical protein
LLDGTFNRGNQLDGSQQQALAGSVAGFATALVNTPGRVPEKLLSRIAHRHASLGIRADQYQVAHDKPDVGDRGRAGRGGHAGGRDGVGRGLLADG